MLKLGTGCVALSAAVGFSAPYYCLWHKISDIVVVVVVLAAVAVGSSSSLCSFCCCFCCFYSCIILFLHINLLRQLAAQGMGRPI